MLTYKYFDILIFDIDSSGVDAVHALKIAKTIQDELHIIVIANNAHILRQKKLDKQIINHLLFKPIQLEHLSKYLKFVAMNREKSKYTQINNLNTIKNRFAEFSMTVNRDNKMKKKRFPSN
jgi:DNA-binding NtrC family response regulator